MRDYGIKDILEYKIHTLKQQKYKKNVQLQLIIAFYTQAKTKTYNKIKFKLHVIPL